MGINIRQLPRGAAQFRKMVHNLGVQAISTGSTLHRVIGGYLMRATVNGANATVTVLDAPVWLALCQPYRVVVNGAPAPFICRVATINRGYDAVRVSPTPRLVYSTLDPTADLTNDDLRYIWYLEHLPVGSQPAGAVAQYTRGVYAHHVRSVAMPLLVTDVATPVLGVWPVGMGTWLRIQHMNISQRIFSLTAEPGEVIPTSERQLSHFQIALTSLVPGAWAAPLNDTAYLDYTVLPGTAPVDDRNGVAHFHVFRGVAPPTNPSGQYNDELQSGLTLARYTVTGEIADTDGRVASLPWVQTVWPDQYAPLLNHPQCRTGITRAAVAGTQGVAVAAVRAPIEVGEDTGTAYGAVVVTFDYETGGASVATLSPCSTLTDPQVYHHAPLLGITTSAGPRVVCVRARALVDEDDVLAQDAEDIVLTLVSPGGTEQVVDLGAYFPHTYLTPTATFSDGRIAMGTYQYPVLAGDWQVQVVQSMCLCAPDVLAVVVRPKAQFNTGASGVTDIHIAMVNATTGALLVVRPVAQVQVDDVTTPMQMSLWNHASLTCVAPGVWVDGEEVTPPRLLLNVFRESGSPSGTPAPPNGTYVSHDGGATFDFLVNMGASLVYSLGSALAPALVGGVDAQAAG